jgi:hypothetical protein
LHGHLLRGGLGVGVPLVGLGGTLLGGGLRGRGIRERVGINA